MEAVSIDAALVRISKWICCAGAASSMSMASIGLEPPPEMLDHPWGESDMNILTRLSRMEQDALEVHTRSQKIMKALGIYGCISQAKPPSEETYG